MKPFHYIILAAVLAGGLAGSILLIPGDSDVGLMYFRGGQYAEAEPILEKRLAAGDLSVGVVMPLAELYVERGNVSRAIELLRRMNASDRDRLELFHKVAIFQKYNQQMQDYLLTLEAIEKMAGSENGLRELTIQYRYADDNGKLIPALQTLIAHYKGYPSEYLELANLLAVGSRFNEAAGVMERFEARHPADVSAETVELLISLLLDSGQAPRALDRAAQWVERHREPETVVRFAALMRSKGQLPLAVRLLAPFESSIDNDPLLLSEWLQQKAASGRNSEALDRLKKLWQRKALPDNLVDTFIDLALNAGELSVAADAGGQVGFDRLNAATLVSLVERTLDARRPAEAFRISSAAGPGFIDAHPLLAARLAFGRGDWAETARYLKIAEENRNLAAVDRVAVAHLDVSLGRQMEAATQLAQISISSLSGELLLDVAREYIAIGKPADGLRGFDRLRTARSTFEADEAWALLAAAGGRGHDVGLWIRAKPARLIPEPLLHELGYLAQDHKQPELALTVAERLFSEKGGDANRLMLARALNSAGQPAAALPHLRALRTGGSIEVEEEYAAALLSAVQGGSGSDARALKNELRKYWNAKLDQGQPDETKQLEVINGLLDLGEWDAALPSLKLLARRREDLVPLLLETAAKAGKQKEAVDFLESDLARTNLSLSTREARVHDLLDIGGKAKALPYLRELAFRELPEWIDAYEDALQQLGRRAELLDFWRARLAGSALTADGKRDIAYKLVDDGKTEWARSLFAELARAAAPDSPDVNEWMFLWGDHPGGEALDWLEQRARGATGVDRVGWLQRLLDAGATDRVIAVVSANPPPGGAGGEIFDIYVRALAARNETAALSAAVARETAALADRKRVRQLATLVRDEGGVAAASPAYERLAALAPSDPEANHWLGIFAYGRARYAEAERYLTTALASSEGSFEDSYYLAEMLWREGKRSPARVYYGRALRLIERLASPSVDARAARAQALLRCGNAPQGLREYRALIATEPRNGELRADYANMLLEAGKYDEADDVLSNPVASGGTRVAILRAHLLASTGHLADAVDLMQSLAGRGAPSPEILAALGSLEQTAGRGRLAEGLIDRAAEMDPRNEDIEDTRAMIEKARAGQLVTESEFRGIAGAQNEDIVRVTGQSVISDAVRALFSMEQDHVSIRDLQRTNGAQGSFDGTVRRGEAAVEWDAEDGTRVKGSLFAGGVSTGGGVSVVRPDLRGLTSAALEIGKSDWDFRESLAQRGVRDRLELRRDQPVNARTSVAIGAAVNRYDLPGLPRAAETVSATGNVGMRLLRSPGLSLNYSVDAEYVLNEKLGETPAGQTFRPLPLASREVHAGSVETAREITRGLHVSGAAGYAVDRFGGSSPFYRGSVNYDRFRHFGAKIDYDHRLYKYDSTQKVTSLRFGIFWLF